MDSHPLLSYNFHVFLDKAEFGFSKVSGIKRTSEPVTYQEGGLDLCPITFIGSIHQRSFIN